MGKAKNQFQMRLEVGFVNTTSERWKEAISLLARAYGKFLEKKRAEGGLLPSNKKGPGTRIRT